jgi:hypothetical protein
MKITIFLGMTPFLQVIINSIEELGVSISIQCKNCKLLGKNCSSALGRSRTGDSYSEPVAEGLWTWRSHGQSLLVARKAERISWKKDRQIT